MGCRWNSLINCVGPSGGRRDGFRFGPGEMASGVVAAFVDDLGLVDVSTGTSAVAIAKELGHSRQLVGFALGDLGGPIRLGRGCDQRSPSGR